MTNPSHCPTIAKRKPLRKQKLRLNHWSLILLAAFLGHSIYEYTTTGKVDWLTNVVQRIDTTVGGNATRPGPGSRQAAEAIETLGAERESIPNNVDITARVVGVTDGDTITVLEDGSQRHKIRLHGIDTPERGQPHYRQAKNALSELIAGATVGIRVVDTDRYGRTVGVIYHDKRNINLAMIQEGHAWWYRKYAQYDRQLQGAETEARKAQRGLWTQTDPIPPWEWRRP